MFKIYRANANWDPTYKNERPIIESEAERMTEHYVWRKSGYDGSFRKEALTRSWSGAWRTTWAEAYADLKGIAASKIEGAEEDIKIATKELALAQEMSAAVAKIEPPPAEEKTE